MNYSIKYGVAKAALAVSLVVGGLSTFATAPTTYAAEASVVDQVREITWGVNLRQGPSTSYSSIRMISKGERVTVVGQASNGWYSVKDSRGNTGYISNGSKYTKLVSGSNNSSNNNNTNNNSNNNSGSSNNNSGSTTNSSAAVEKVIAAGMKYLGTPYEYGSNRNSTATFDCSAFVRRAFQDALGVTLPADSRKQGAYVKELGNAKTSISQLQRGDLMFFMSYKGSSKSSYSGVNKSTARITHVGIYLGDGKILHTYSNASGGVRTDTVTGKHWEYRFLYGGSAIK